MRNVKKFNTRERVAIARLLEIDIGAPAATKWIAAIEQDLNRSRAWRAQSSSAWAAEIKKRGLRNPRGRPDGQGLDTLSNLYSLALIYQGVTKKQIRNTRSHAFHHLAQICLSREDFSRLITQLKRPPWNLGKAIELPPGLASARQLVCEVTAQALRPDPE